jgi:hypothetical protein
VSATVCTWCEEPMDGRSCIGKPLKDTAVVEGVSYYRVPFVLLHGHHCHDCATPHDGLHHPGCDSERCPRCLGQAISCGCRWDGDTPDPDFDEEGLNPESPEARRVS